MTFYENAVSIILSSMNQSALKKIKDSCKNEKFIDDINANIQGDSYAVDKKGVIIKKSKTPVNFLDVNSNSYDWRNEKQRLDDAFKDIRASFIKKPVKDDGFIFMKKALKDPAFIATMESFGVPDAEIKNFTDYKKLIEMLARAKAKSAIQFGAFAKKINGVVSRAYRENEHLYDIGINTVINTSVLPGMILDSYNDSPSFNRPRFKGYVTSVTHSLDFNAASLKTSIALSRAASDDSGVGA